MGAKDQLKALLYKTFVLQLRQIKSNIFQLLITLVLVLIPAIVFINSNGRDTYYYGSYYSQLHFNKADSFSNCYIQEEEREGVCSEFYTNAVFSDPPGGPSAGSLSNDTSIPHSGLLGGILQVRAEIYNYTEGSYVHPLTPTFQPFDSPADMQNFIVQQISQFNEWGVPNVGFEFTKISYEEGQVEYTILSPYYPNDYYPNFDFPYNVYPSPYYNALYYENMIANGFLTNVTGKRVEMVPEVTAFYSNSSSPNYSPQGLVGFIFITPSLCLLLPVYVFAIVVEKSNKSLELNKLMGLNMVCYWTSHYITGYILYLLPLVSVILVGLFFQIGFIADSWSVSIVLFGVWGLSQLSLAFFLSTLFSKERIATIISYAIVFGSLLIAMIINLFIFKNNSATWWYMLWPTWAFVRGFYLIQNRFTNHYFPPLTLSELSFSSEFVFCIFYLLFEAVFYFLLAVYLEMVMPREWGMRKRVYFPIADLFSFIRHKLKSSSISIDHKINSQSSEYADDESANHELQNAALVRNKNILDGEGKNEDEDSVISEKNNATSANPKYLLRCVDISKKFGEKIALNSLFLAVEEGECFGLLGPNGAGKTTLISIISGIIAPTTGYCYIAGKYTNTADTSYREEIGICPQFDILWDDLTIREHLNYYHLIHGLKKDEKLHVMVNQIADRVCLSDHMDKKVKELSGGMKRKLSIAISLVGDPKLLLLDEPTTGLDPDARREVWDLLSDARVGRSTIITTHNMEEADVLSSRIGIVTHGRLACVGNQQYLKNRFGKGYNLTITCVDEHAAHQIIDFMKSSYPNSSLDSFYSNLLVFIIPFEDINIASLFVTMRNQKHLLGIKEWGLNQSSLEEVFLNLVREEEGAAHP